MAVKSHLAEDKLDLVQSWDMRAALAGFEVSRRCSHQHLLAAGKDRSAPLRQPHVVAWEQFSSSGVGKAIFLRQ